jgi:hypothetical protein
MPDLQVLRFENGVPVRYAELNLPLNADGTFEEGPIFLFGLDKAIQDLVKGLLTVLGTSTLAPNYGTILSGLLNARKASQISGKVVAQIRYLLGYLGTFNANESLDERIDQILSIKSKENGQSLSLEITLRTGSGSTGTVTLV